MSLRRAFALFLVLILIPRLAIANEISGTVKDPSGAVLADAQVTVRNQASSETLSVKTDSEGRFRFANIASGSFLVTVAPVKGLQGFERLIVVEADKPFRLDIVLPLQTQKETVDVSSRGSNAPNSDANYRALRDAAPAEAYKISNLILKRDAGTLTLTNGQIVFLPPVLGKVTAAVFTGEGEFTLQPPKGIEANYLRLITQKESVQEPFQRLVLVFTDDTHAEILRQAQQGGDDPRARDLWKDFHKRMRRRADRARSMMEALLGFEDVENVEAEVLADLYNPQRAGSFTAYIFGRKHGDLRYYLRPRGAFPQISPEEVAVVNVDPQGDEEGIWYLAHLLDEQNKRTASSQEDKRLVHAQHYRIETAIRGEKLSATADLRLESLASGVRVLKFGLLPSLRVTRVSMTGREVSFLQEQKNEDGSFYVIFPETLAKGQVYPLTVEYTGDKVVENAGGGSFAVGARTSWYPSLNAFTDRATLDLTFKVPSRYTLVSIGKLVKQWREEDYAASQWVSEIPLAVAGFNYGIFQKKEVKDADTHYQIEGYATSEVPDYLRQSEMRLSPTQMTQNAMVEAQNALRVFSLWFGEAPYGRLAITQQPQFNFGQSWPTLVYLPISAFLDSTQRWMLMGSSAFKFADFIQEVTPHEVAHQWWGHMVGWSSYHDQWLSEGFADFSAGLYLQATEKKPDKALQFWERNRTAILEKNQYGHRPTDAGPIWMGLRLNTAKTAGAYNRLVYPKGAYVLRMLRSLMYDGKTGDQDFIAMMHDFVKTHLHQNASTESFKAVVEKHMKPSLDMDRNGRMDWFFQQWVYGTDVPRYRLDYSLIPEADGKVRLKGRLTQSEVPESFKMQVPIYVDFEGELQRIGRLTVRGTETPSDFEVLLPKKPKRVLINAYHDVLAVESVSASHAPGS